MGESKTDTTPTARDSFHYGPDGARYFKKSEWAVTSGDTTTMKTSRKYYAGAYEKTVTVGGDTVERVRIGDSVVHVKTTPAGMMARGSSVFEYVHRDHLGSVEAVTDQAGNELVVLGHDPYGERRKPDWTGQLTRAEIEALLGAHGERVSRGFTRHEHLDRTGLIHMNGRMYDPRLGRFLSPDPIVGDVTSSRSWNLYSYVGNNPLSYVDPTGLIQEGWCDGITCLHFGDGGAGGGSTTRTTTVTTTETVHGVMAVPYRYAVPVWTRVGGSAWPGGNDYVYDLTYDYFWGVDYQPYSHTYNVTRTVALEDQSPADEPADSGWAASAGVWIYDFVIGDAIETADKTVDAAASGDWGGAAVGAINLTCEVAKACKAVVKAAKSVRKLVNSLKKERHHADPKFLGGDPKQPLTKMRARTHRQLHKDLNDFLRQRTDAAGRHMRPQRGNSGAKIQQNFDRSERLEALRDFYRGPGAKYKDAARDFFEQHPDL